MGNNKRLVAHHKNNIWYVVLERDHKGQRRYETVPNFILRHNAFETYTDCIKAIKNIEALNIAL